MPLVRLLGYYHAALWVNGAWTVRAKRETASLEALFAAIPNDESDD